MKTLVELRDVTFGYEEHPVLENVTFRITERDYILVIGPNGGGKTTLLKLILGIEKPWSGSVTLRQGLAERMGYVPQYATLNRNFPISVLDMVLTGLVSGSTYLSAKHPSHRERALEMIENVGLQEKGKSGSPACPGGSFKGPSSPGPWSPTPWFSSSMSPRRPWTSPPGKASWTSWKG